MQQKIPKKVFVSETSAFELVALNCLYSEQDIFHP